MFKPYWNRFKNFILREKHVLIAFFITAFALTVFAVAAGIAPFGRNSLLAIDLWGQYYPMMWEKLSDFFSAWSWNGALGFSTVPQSAYYTNSVFLLLLLPFQGYARLAALDLMIFLKLSLASAAFAYYLGKKLERRDVFAGIFGAAYGLGAYTLAFISQPMWLDVVLLFPLILRALERLINGEGMRSYLSYTLLLALAIFSNFYISFALCLFLVLWFLFYASTEWSGFRRFVKAGLRFAGASAAAGLLCAGMLIPLALHMENWISSSIGFSGEYEWYHGFTEIADAFSWGAKSSLEYGVANLFCTSAAILLALLFLLNGEIPLKKRIPLFSLAALLFVSFEWNLLDFIWHGLHFPNQLPGRQSFLFIFLVLLMGYEALSRLGGIRLYGLCIAFFVSLGFLSYGIDKSKNAMGRTFSILVIVTVFVLLAFFLAAKRRSFPSRFAKAAIALVLTVDICANAIFVLCMYGKASDAHGYVGNEAQMRAFAEKYGSGETDFYREEMTPAFTFNPGQLYGYKGMTYYSSTMNGKTYHLMQNLGNRVYAQNVSTIYMPTPLQDMMFGVKYHYLQGRTLAWAKRVEKAGGISVYESPYALPVAYAVSPNIKNMKFALKQGLALQEKFIGLASGLKKRILSEAEVVDRSISNGIQIGQLLYARDEESAVTYTVEFAAWQDGYFCLEFDFKVGTYEVVINEGSSRTGHCNADPILNTEYLLTGDRVRVTVTTRGYSGINCGIRGYTFDEQALPEAYEKLSAGAMQVEYASDTQIRGT
ncbi:MAG: YfhO family protein, partial [Clostridia bacterium]|nr:YfhO family protein [Clostridia bacterium]